MMRSERGSSVLELALVLPIFLMLTIGLMDFSVAVWSEHTIANAAHDAARYAAVRAPTDGEITTFVRDNAIGLQPQRLEVTATWQPDRNPGSTVRVVVRYPFDPVTPFVARDRIRLEASAEMVVQ